MNNLENFYSKTFQYDLVNKFLFKSTKTLPKIKKIILNFGCKNSDTKQLATTLLAIELISSQKGRLTTTKYPNILLKLRKGSPVGCKVTLRKTKIFNFISHVLTDIFPKIKNFEGLKISKKNKQSTFSYEIQDTFGFGRLEENYYLFHDLPTLSVTLVTTCKQEKQLKFLLNSLKTPFQ